MRAVFGAANAWEQCAPAAPDRRDRPALNFTVRGHDVCALALAVHWSLRPTLAT
jgi:hypothetical protein